MRANHAKKKAIKVLSAQQFDPVSDWAVNFLPFGSIYWKDEWPEALLAELFEQVDDLSIIHAMFGMRLKIWNGEVLSAQDRALWDAVERQVPKWALFKRLALSDEQRCAREEAERLVEKEFNSLGADGDPE